MDDALSCNFSRKCFAALPVQTYLDIKEFHVKYHQIRSKKTFVTRIHINYLTANLLNILVCSYNICQQTERQFRQQLSGQSDLHSEQIHTKCVLFSCRPIYLGDIGVVNRIWVRVLEFYFVSFIFLAPVAP